MNEPVFVIGAVNRDVTVRTGLGGTRSVSRIRLHVRLRGRGEMALQTGGVDAGHAQQLRIRAAVRRVTGCAAGLPDCFVFIDPGAGYVGVALEAPGNLLRNGRLQTLLKGAVRVVTDCAFGWAVISFMVNRRGELRLNRGVALVAKRGLRRLQQLPFLTGVDGMTVGATNIRGGVS